MFDRASAWPSVLTLGLTLVLAVPGATDPPRTKVPRGKNVLVNGSFAPREWSDAAKLPLDAGHVLLVKQDREYVYLGIRFETQKHSGLELFLAPPSGPPLALHVSSALGTRTWGATGWSERQWRADHWGANVVGTITEDGKMKVLEPDGFEVQIEKSLLPGRDLALRIELKRPGVVFPAGSREEDRKDWIRLAL